MRQLQPESSSRHFPTKVMMNHEGGLQSFDDVEQVQTTSADAFVGLQQDLPSVFNITSLTSMPVGQGYTSLIDTPPFSIRHDPPPLLFNAIEPTTAFVSTARPDAVRNHPRGTQQSQRRRLAPKSNNKLVAATADPQYSRNHTSHSACQVTEPDGDRVGTQVQKNHMSQLHQDHNVLKRKRGRPSKRGETCIRCKLRREGCNGGTPCDRCKVLSPYAHICIPADFAGKRLLGRGLYAARARNLLQHCQWIPFEEGSSPIYVELTNGFPFTLRLQAQRFVALNDEPIRYCLFKGLASWEKPHRPPSSPYGLVPGSLSNSAVDEYLDSILPYLIERVVTISTAPSVFNKVLLAAYHAMNSSVASDVDYELPGWHLIRIAFRIWIIQGIFFDLQNQIDKGADQIGVVPLQVPGYFNNMRCPPRLLNIQLEAVFEQRMDALESELLYSLQDAIHEPKRGQWLSVFFATFLFMVSLEKDSWNLGSWGIELQRAGGSQWPLGTSAPGPEVHGEQNQTLANMLGTVFQVRCQGSVPLKLNWDSAGVKKLVENDEQKVAFLKSLADLISNEDHRATLEAKKKAVFDRNDKNSLELMFASKLLLD